MSYLDRARERLADIDAADRRRRVRARVPSGAVDFSSNDYLSLADDARVLAAMRGASRAGSSGSRLLGGAHPEHLALEEELAAFTGRERALLFSSGYLAALGAIATLAETVGVAYSDERNHASLIDALRACKLPRRILPHGAPLPATREHSALVVVESLYGMDGDALDVRAFVRALGPADTSLVDEAHALGLAGDRGAGFMHGIADPRVVVLGTLSKAFASAGGFLAGPAAIVELAVNVARTFIFDTSAPLPAVEAARAALRVIASDEGEERRASLRANVARLRDRLGCTRAPFSLDPNAHAAAPFVSIVFGPEVAALAVATELETRGFFAPAIRPPTVPPGTSRIRAGVRALHTAGEIDAFAAALEDVALALAART